MSYISGHIYSVTPKYVSWKMLYFIVITLYAQCALSRDFWNIIIMLIILFHGKKERKTVICAKSEKNDVSKRQIICINLKQP